MFRAFSIVAMVLTYEKLTSRIFTQPSWHNKRVKKIQSRSFCELIAFDRSAEVFSNVDDVLCLIGLTKVV